MAECLVHPIETVPRALLAPLLDEEMVRWERDLNWSFGPSRHRLESALAEGTVNGYLATDAEGPCAYATYSTHEGHGVVGSFFAASRSQGRGLEDLLVRNVLTRLVADRLSVIDCQTLFSSDPGLKEPFSAFGFQSAARLYMILDRPAWMSHRRVTAPLLRTRPTHRADLRQVARLVFESHEETRGHDASSSFDTLDSCARILRQIILDEVCGPFDSAASRRVEERGQALAACLLTWPLKGVAHVSEVATSTARRREGLGRQCLQESLQSAFERSGATLVTLSVTASNQKALALYESVGFAPALRYESHVLRSSSSC